MWSTSKWQETHNEEVFQSNKKEQSLIQASAGRAQLSLPGRKWPQFKERFIQNLLGDKTDWGMVATKNASLWVGDKWEGPSEGKPCCLSASYGELHLQNCWNRGGNGKGYLPPHTYTYGGRESGTQSAEERADPFLQLALASLAPLFMDGAKINMYCSEWWNMLPGWTPTPAQNRAARFAPNVTIQFPWHWTLSVRFVSGLLRSFPLHDHG